MTNWEENYNLQGSKNKYIIILIVYNGQMNVYQYSFKIINFKKIVNKAKLANRFKFENA